MSFDVVIEYVMEYEGGYANHEEDSGGETKFGVTHYLYEIKRPNGDWQNFTKRQAKNLYKEVFWKKEFNDIDISLQLVFLDTLVNHGQGKGTRMIQFGLGVDKDGIFGPITLKAARESDPTIVIGRILEKRKIRMLNHPFVSGLLSRLLRLQSDSLNLYYAKNMARIDVEQSEVENVEFDNQ